MRSAFELDLVTGAHLLVPAVAPRSGVMEYNIDVRVAVLIDVHLGLHHHARVDQADEITRRNCRVGPLNLGALPPVRFSSGRGPTFMTASNFLIYSRRPRSARVPKISSFGPRRRFTAWPYRVRHICAGSGAQSRPSAGPATWGIEKPLSSQKCTGPRSTSSCTAGYSCLRSIVRMSSSVEPGRQRRSDQSSA